MPNKHTIPNQYSKTKPKIVICINSLTSTPYEAYTNHIQTFFHLGRFYRQFNFCIINTARMGIDKAKNLAAKTALDIEAKYLLILDDDVLIPAPFDFLDKLIACKAPIAAANVMVRGWPFMHMWFKYTKDKRGLNLVKNIKKPAGPIEVDAVGFSCVLIETKLLKEMNAPYFETSPNQTEDVNFCLKVRDKFPNAKIIVDTSIECGHILWPEVIREDNLVNYRKYFKNQNHPIDGKMLQRRLIPYYQMAKQLTDTKPVNKV